MHSDPCTVHTLVTRRPDWTGGRGLRDGRAGRHGSVAAPDRALTQPARPAACVDPPPMTRPAACVDPPR